MLEKTQPQRLREELIILLKEKQPLSNIKRLKSLYGFGFVQSGLSAASKDRSLLEKARREVLWFEKKFPGYRRLDTWLVYFMALLDGSSTAQTKALCKKLVFRKGDEKRILSFKKINKAFVTELNRKSILPDSIFLLLRPLSFEVVILLRAKYKNREFREHLAEFLEVYNDMRLCVSGDDLCVLGLKPGPHYKQLFAKVLSAKLNGLVKTHAQELEMVKALICKK
jgi:tRNA nucleotidyltransferase (CCA-adding enzyme)